MASQSGEDGRRSSSSSRSVERQFAPITRTESETSARQEQSSAAPDTPRRTYGTLGSSEQPGDTQSSRQAPSETPPDPARSPVIPPERQSQRRPPVVRRPSGKPYRGQQFSVDDDVTEYEEDRGLRHVHSAPRLARGVSGGTLRRRPGAHSPSLHRINSGTGLDENFAARARNADDDGRIDEDDGNKNDNDEDEEDEETGDINDDGDEEDEDDDEDISDTESFTLKDRQQAINQTHPFGIRIWKPALYKKFRSVERKAEGDIHSVPGERVSFWLYLINIGWTLLFGWWLCLISLLGSVVCFIFLYSEDAADYGSVFFTLAGYLLWPFGSFVLLESDDHYAEEDEGEGRSISEYEQWQSGDIERGGLFFGPTSATRGAGGGGGGGRGGRSLVGRRRSSIDSAASEYDSLLGGAGRRGQDDRPFSSGGGSKRRFFGRGEWTVGRVVFYTFFYLLVGPSMLLVSVICWLLVFTIPMGRVTMTLLHHLRRHPLALTFHLDSHYSCIYPRPRSSSILLCTYRAAGLQYWKYTVDGTNIFLINLLAIVIFVIFDYWVLHLSLGFKSWLTHPGLMFTLGLVSIIPLAYFIGQAVASISAQSSMGLGAAINAFFATVVEVYLYCVALTEGKARLVEGSIIGSIFAGILFLPGLSMCFGAIKRKTQRFNVKSAGVTSTMLLFAVVAAFGPTLFYEIYGSQKLNCRPCGHEAAGTDCRRCYFDQVPDPYDPFFTKAVQPYSWFAAVLLFLSYIVGLWFTLRTHAAIIWASEHDEKKMQHPQPPTHDPLPPPGQRTPTHQHHHPSGGGPKASHGAQKGGSIRESALYSRILSNSLSQAGLAKKDNEDDSSAPHVVPPQDGTTTKDGPASLFIPGLSEEQNRAFVRQVAELAATAAAVAARDVTGKPPTTRKPQPATSGAPPHQGLTPSHSKHTVNTARINDEEPSVFTEQHHAPDGGHDAPNWGKAKSTAILLVATVAYAAIAEILVNTVDVVLESVDIEEKFLGFTLFALVPNTTEFLNAISFAMNGNIALSMEIGSAYALQVCLLQIPALVLFSALQGHFFDSGDLLSHSFTLIFPQFDMITVILCVFLLSYVYGEGKSNYFKGSVLVLTYLFVVGGFYLSRFTDDVNARGVDVFDTLAIGERERLLISTMV